MRQVDTGVHFSVHRGLYGLAGCAVQVRCEHIKHCIVGTDIPDMTAWHDKDKLSKKSELHFLEFCWVSNGANSEAVNRR